MIPDLLKDKNPRYFKSSSLELLTPPQTKIKITSSRSQNVHTLKCGRSCGLCHKSEDVIFILRPHEPRPPRLINVFGSSLREDVAEESSSLELLTPPTLTSTQSVDVKVGGVAPDLLIWVFTL